MDKPLKLNMTLTDYRAQHLQSLLGVTPMTNHISINDPGPTMISFMAMLQAIQERITIDRQRGLTTMSLKDIDLGPGREGSIHTLRAEFNSSPLQVARLLDCHVMYDTRNGRVVYSGVPFSATDFSSSNHFHIIR